MNTILRNNLREAYNKTARERDKQAAQDWKLDLRRQFLDLLVQEQKGTLLEIGGGPGKDSLYFQEQGLEVVCTDLSPEMVKLCKGKGLTAYEMDISNMQIPDDSFDAVYALNCTLHFRKGELPEILRTINAIMKSGGLFYMGVYGGRDYEGIWSEDSYDPKRFFSFYEDEHLKQVVGEIFDIVSFKQIASGSSDSDLHFQSMVLRKKKSGSNKKYAA